MKDVRNKEIEVGDQVAVIAKNYKHLVIAEVVKITPKSVLVEYLNTWNYGSKGSLEKYRVTQDMFIKI